MTKPELELNVKCDECGCHYAVNADTVNRNASLACPVCGHTTSHVAFEVPQGEWDGTLEETEADPGNLRYTTQPTDREPMTMREALRRASEPDDDWPECDECHERLESVRDRPGSSLDCPRDDL